MNFPWAPKLTFKNCENGQVLTRNQKFAPFRKLSQIRFRFPLICLLSYLKMRKYKEKYRHFDSKVTDFVKILHYF